MHAGRAAIPANLEFSCPASPDRADCIVLMRTGSATRADGFIGRPGDGARQSLRAGGGASWARRRTGFLDDAPSTFSVRLTIDGRGDGDAHRCATSTHFNPVRGCNGGRHTSSRWRPARLPSSRVRDVCRVHMIQDGQRRASTSTPARRIVIGRARRRGARRPRVTL